MDFFFLGTQVTENNVILVKEKLKMEYILFIIAFLCGGSIGASIVVAISHKKKSGTVHITYNSFYDEPYIFLELGIPIEKLSKLKTVQFSVDPNPQWNTHK